MSVITFTTQEIANLTTSLSKKVHNGMDGINHTVLYSEAYLRKMRHEGGNENENIKALIGWMFDHLYRANTFAAISQYGSDGIVKFDGEYPDDAKIYSDKDLISKLRSLDYNLADNAGNMFVEPIYYDLFKSIQESLMRTFYDNATDEAER